MWTKIDNNFWQTDFAYVRRVENRYVAWRHCRPVLYWFDDLVAAQNAAENQIPTYRIISGGQSGADLAGLKVGKKLKLETGGYMPKGFLTEFGNKPEYANEYNMQEHNSPKYPPRTYLNCKSAHATARFFLDQNSTGEKLTMKAILQYNKPYFDVDIKNPPEILEFQDWLRSNNVRILNISGNRESSAAGIEEFVIDYLGKALNG